MKRGNFVHFILFLGYLAILIYLVLFSQGFGRVVTVRDYNLVPLKTISSYFRYRSAFGDRNYYINIYGNILAFMPLGYFMFVMEKTHRFFKSFLIPFIVSLSIEIAQIKMSVGSFDVDDIILNTLGGFSIYFLLYCIYLVLKLFRKRSTHEKK